MVNKLLIISSPPCSGFVAYNKFKVATTRVKIKNVL
jgi:hypothetical protein